MNSSNNVKWRVFVLKIYLDLSIFIDFLKKELILFI